MNPLNGYQTYIVGGLTVLVGVISFFVNTAYPDAHFPIDNGSATLMVSVGLGMLGLRNAMGKIDPPKD